MRRAVLLVALTADAVTAEHRPIPEEPIEIGTTPQFLIDDYVVDSGSLLPQD
jgi:hypothetical protein